VIPALPFELAAAPRRLFAVLRLPVVSYALPALIAMGLARHRMRPTRNPVARLARHLTTARVLRVLEMLQPANGGFLEATPLTSFVAMSLVGARQHNHIVVQRALQFVRSSVRSDGSWPIDTHLATWVTTLAVSALQDADVLSQIDHPQLTATRHWLVEQQHLHEHVYTGASPGGWAWTPLPGGVPDADDTAGAVLALAALPHDQASVRAATAGVQWLLSLQNRDGGIPTFCRGWGALPFDRSGADLTAHAIRAWDVWIDRLEPGLRPRIERGIDRAIRYLRRSQRRDGAFLPLWFGNESADGDANPTYGTARVIRALVALKRRGRTEVDRMLDDAVQWLLSARNADGGWGGDRGVPSSIEETSLVVGALADADTTLALGAITDGCGWLAAATAGGTRFHASPIGLYFAKLWYSESLYPLIFSVGGLARACRVLRTDSQ
jgi:squalene-hopene/tetraprenyl-beta-curcumene cyclase